MTGLVPLKHVTDCSIFVILRSGIVLNLLALWEWLNFQWKILSNSVQGVIKHM